MIRLTKPEYKFLRFRYKFLVTMYHVRLIRIGDKLFTLVLSSDNGQYNYRFGDIKDI